VALLLQFYVEQISIFRMFHTALLL